MPNPWTGYAAVNDDVRHTYERVFYGRQLTGNLTENEVPGMAGTLQEKTAPALGQSSEVQPAVTSADLYGADQSREAREATATAWTHAENAPGVRREIETAEGRPYMHTDAPPIEARGSATRADLYGPGADSTADAGTVWGKEAGAGQPETSRAADLYGPASTTPAAEPPNVQPPAPAADMTPG